MFVLKEVTLGSSFTLFDRVFPYLAATKRYRFQTTRGTLSLVDFLRLKSVFSLMNISFMKGGFSLFKVL